MTALASNTLLSVCHSDSLTTSWKTARFLVSRDLSQGGGGGQRTQAQPLLCNPESPQNTLSPAAVGRRRLGQAVGGNTAQPLLPGPHAAPQECWAQELEAGVGCLAGLLAACSLPPLLVLATAWGVFHVFLAWKEVGWTLAGCSWGEVPLLSTKVCEDTPPWGIRRKERWGQNSLAKPSSSLVPEKVLRTLHIPISISATNPNHWGGGWTGS